MRCSLIAVLATVVTVAHAQASAAPFSCPQNTNPPSGAVCGKHGRLSAAEKFESVQSQAVKANIFQCRDKCLGFPSNCLAWGWNTRTRVCTFYDLNVRAMGYTQSGSYVSYHDAECYTCTRCRAILDNPGFEQPTSLSPWIAQRSSTQTTFSVASTGSNSTHSAQISLSPNVVADLSQYVYQCPGRSYTLEFDYKFANSNPATIQGFMNEDKNNRTSVIAITNSASMAGKWQHATGVTTEAVGDGLIEIRMTTTSGSQVIQLDNFEYNLLLK